MVCGFGEFKKVFIEKEFVDLKDVFKIVGMMMVSKVGGVFGLFYGIVFLNMSKVVDLEIIDVEGLIKVFEVGFEGIEKCGKFYVGEKIMIDVWELVVNVIYQEDLIDDVVDVVL